MSLFCVLKEHRRENFESESCSRFSLDTRESEKSSFPPTIECLQPPHLSSSLSTSSTTVVVVLHTHITTQFSLSRAMIFPCYATHFSLNFLLLFFTLFSISGVFVFQMTSQQEKMNLKNSFHLRDIPWARNGITKLRSLMMTCMTWILKINFVALTARINFFTHLCDALKCITYIHHKYFVNNNNESNPNVCVRVREGFHCTHHALRSKCYVCARIAFRLELVLEKNENCERTENGRGADRNLWFSHGAWSSGWNHLDLKIFNYDRLYQN